MTHAPPAHRLRAPHQLCHEVEKGSAPRWRAGENFAGYGVMGLPFDSGHVLALRRFPHTSIGHAYTSVWHRDPSGRWTFRQDVPDEVSCPRYFGAALTTTRRDELTLTWPDQWTLEIAGTDLRWRVELEATPASKFMSGVSSRLPATVWETPALLAAMERAAGGLMRVGRVGLRGTTPNGHRFVASPLRVWMVATSSATIDGEDLGRPGPLAEQARLADFRLPQRGVFAIGHSRFEPQAQAA